MSHEQALAIQRRMKPIGITFNVIGILVLLGLYDTGRTIDDYYVVMVFVVISRCLLWHSKSVQHRVRRG